MVNDVLSTIKNIPTEEIETAVVNSHVLGEGYYFILHDDNELEGSYRVTKENCGMTNDKQEWFRRKDFFSMWLNNDANKALSVKVKNWLSAVPFMLSFKKSSLCKIKGSEDAIIQSVLKREEHCRKMPECVGLADGGEDVYKKAVYRLTGCMEKALECLAGQGITVGDTDRIKIFLDYEDEEYIRSGKKYLYTSLFHKSTVSVADGKTTGTPALFINLNRKKPYLSPREMRYSTPFCMCMEDAYRMYMLFELLKIRQKNGVVYIPYDNFDLSEIGNDENIEGYRLTLNKGVVVDFSANIRPEQDYDFSVADYAGIKNLKPMKISDAIKWYILGLRHRKDSTGEDGDVYFVSGNSLVAKQMPVFEYGIEKYIETGSMPDTPRRMLWQQAYWQIKQCINNKGLLAWENYARNIVNTWLNIIYKGKDVNMQENVTAISNDGDYCYAAGQLAYFLASRSGLRETRRREARDWMMITSSKALVIKLQKEVAKHASECPDTDAFTSLVAGILDYAKDARTFCTEKFITGFFSRNLVGETLTDRPGNLTTDLDD